MSTVLLPFDQAAESQSLPAGKYRVQVVDAALGETQKGDQKVVIKYLVLAPKTVNGVRTKGQRISQNYLFTEWGLESLRQAVSALLNRGIPHKAAQLDLEKLIGKVCEAEARQRGEFVNLVNYKPVSKDEDEGEAEGAEDLDDGDSDDE